MQISKENLKFCRFCNYSLMSFGFDYLSCDNCDYGFEIEFADNSITWEVFTIQELYNNKLITFALIIDHKNLEGELKTSELNPEDGFFFIPFLNFNIEINNLSEVRAFIQKQLKLLILK